MMPERFGPQPTDSRLLAIAVLADLPRHAARTAVVVELLVDEPGRLLTVRRAYF